MTQHVCVMVALDHQAVAAIEHFDHMRRNTTGIGQHPKVPLAITQNELSRLTRIVWNREGLNLQITQRKGRVTVEYPQIQLSRQIARHAGTVTHMHSERTARRRARYTADVIAMLMGDEDRIQILRGQPQPRQAHYQFARTKAAVDQNPCSPTLDNQGIALAAATE